MRFNNIHPQKFNKETSSGKSLWVDDFFEHILQSNSLGATKIYYLTKSSFDHIQNIRKGLKGEVIVPSEDFSDEVIYVMLPSKISAVEGIEGFYYYNRCFFIVDTSLGRHRVLERIDIDLDRPSHEKNTYAALTDAVLMVNSIGQDLNFPLIKSKDRKKISGKTYRNKSKFKVHIINDTLHNGFTRRVDKCDVKGFVRLQRYGPGFSKVKKVYIQPHVRKFKKDKPLEDS
jgi:hypothetical protein